MCCALRYGSAITSLIRSASEIISARPFLNLSCSSSLMASLLASEWIISLCSLSDKKCLNISEVS